ncbi:MAG: NAD(P)H-dependent glycerol-3-phosphate dehydrogenase [Bryobacteraceae bacterium]
MSELAAAARQQTAERLAIVGAGSWGTALAIALSPRFSSVHLWARDPGRAAAMNRLRENRRYLPAFLLPVSVRVSCDLKATLEGAQFVILAVPSHSLRFAAQAMRPHLMREATLVSATKGIEEGTLLRMSEVIAQCAPPACAAHIAVLSGPTFAKEIAAGEPAAVVVACEDPSTSARIQHAFCTPSLRLYASQDVIGVELGAALKNVIAIAAGICRGLGLGSNTAAALVTRGLAEITRLALMMGASPRTLSGLAGLGDLVLTTTGELSRNRHVGIQLGQGHALKEVLASMTMIAEGVATCRAARELGLRNGVDLPIANKMYEVLYESKDPRQALSELMNRPLTHE